MERRRGVLPRGEGEIGEAAAREGGGLRGGSEWSWRSHLCVIKAVLMGGARQWKGGQSRWRAPGPVPPPPSHEVKLGTASSSSSPPLRGFHQWPSRGRVLRLEGDGGVQMGAPAMAPWKALINSLRQSKLRHANEGGPRRR
ncbi:unnamed protein product [Pleuronectes platessa]|uniref:Uncharacterized protein n=1 Tax=Pleuronectes platessa TaxID=8262 RepID=A0A9N7YJM8_PLEPL|nr:unnamed protein product [Pleuronectes platessa]